MTTEQHKHIIGLLRKSEYSELVTLNELLKHQTDQREYNEFLKNDTLYSKCGFLKKSEYTLKQYADFRKNTDLTRFRYCPDCGEKIDWNAIKNGGA
jgi:hypothetical protein